MKKVGGVPMRTVASQMPGGSLRPTHRRWRLSWRMGVLAIALLGVVLWAAAPGVRALTLVGNWSHRGEPSISAAGFPVRDVRFAAADGVRLSGWLAVAGPQAPVVILVHGFKGTRMDMLSWARFLFAAGYSVLLYDSRGCGASAGWHIDLGATEADDVVGAVRFLLSQPALAGARVGVLGISLGAGDALLAAAREDAIAAVVADSAWSDEHAQLDRMGRLPVGPVTVPALPYEPALVDGLVGSRLADARPVAVIGHITPRAVLLIHSADDANATTPLSGERALYAAARMPKEEWIAPSGGHAGALAAHPSAYTARVLDFFAQYLGAPPHSHATAPVT
jgi:pimeloyl-ACP methyl ester carboxylesterase